MLQAWKKMGSTEEKGASSFIKTWSKFKSGKQTEAGWV